MNYLFEENLVFSQAFNLFLWLLYMFSVFIVNREALKVLEEPQRDLYLRCKILKGSDFAWIGISILLMILAGYLLVISPYGFLTSLIFVNLLFIPAYIFERRCKLLDFPKSFINLNRVQVVLCLALLLRVFSI